MIPSIPDFKNLPLPDEGIIQPYWSTGCATSPEACFVNGGSYDKQAWSTYVTSVLPSLKDTKQPTYIYLPPASVIKDQPQVCEPR